MHSLRLKGLNLKGLKEGGVVFLLLAVMGFLPSCKSIEFIGVSELKTEKMNLSETELSFKLVLNNPNWIGFRLDNNRYTIGLKGIETHLESTDVWRLKRGKNYLDCKVKYLTLANLMAAKQWIQNGFDLENLELEVQGESDLKFLLFKKHYRYKSKLKVFE